MVENTRKKDWERTIKNFKAYLLLERALSQNSIDAYVQDIAKLQQYLEIIQLDTAPEQLSTEQLSHFIHWLHELGLEASSQARIISGMKAFFKYLLIEDRLEQSPAELLEGPKLNRHIPDILSVAEVTQLCEAIDHSTPLGLRNRALLETLYACGLRVSELIDLRLSNFFPTEGFVKVFGKNKKERIVPIGEDAIRHIGHYLLAVRQQQDIVKGHENILFLNRRGKKLSRVMIFNIIKDLAVVAGIEKNISPHTFRHTFATHLIEGGADLKVVQDLLGHESIITTEIYTHLNTEYLRETILLFHPRNQQAKQP